MSILKSDYTISEFYLFSGIRGGRFYVPTKWIYSYYLAYCKEFGYPPITTLALFARGFNRQHSNHTTSYRTGYRQINKTARNSLIKWIKANFPNTLIPELVSGKKSRKPSKLFHGNNLTNSRPVVDSLGRIYSTLYVACKRNKINFGNMHLMMRNKKNRLNNLMFWYLDAKYLPLIPKDFLDGHPFFNPSMPTVIKTPIIKN